MAITSVALADIEPGQVVQTDLTLEDFLDLDPDALEPPYFEYEGDGLIRRKMSPNTDHAAIAFGLSHLFGAYRDRTGRSLYGYVELRTNVGDRSRLPDVAIYVGSRPAENVGERISTDRGAITRACAPAVRRSRSVHLWRLLGEWLTDEEKMGS